jgi:hypothetical protein
MNQQEGTYKGKVFILSFDFTMGDKVALGEAALGICFPLKAHSSYPMHPVPHLSHFILFSSQAFECTQNSINQVYQKMG